MIANYGYTDAEGDFYVTIDQDRCAPCREKPCLAACPKNLLVAEEDPYGEVVTAVDERGRRRLKYECMDCKPPRDRPRPPCVAACPVGAIGHSW
ncbi:MAG: ferredoxin [Deltaproteobacteria bacterium]|nr:ferredoxin [Deltaproteobacteria bacterium]